MQQDNRLIPLNIKIEKSKNELRHFIKEQCIKYDFPGDIIGLVLESVLAEEKQQRLSYLVEQIAIETENSGGEVNGD